jgi:hypothetical protein
VVSYIFHLSHKNNSKNNSRIRIVQSKIAFTYWYNYYERIDSPRSTNPDEVAALSRHRPFVLVWSFRHIFSTGRSLFTWNHRQILQIRNKSHRGAVSKSSIVHGSPLKLSRLRFLSFFFPTKAWPHNMVCCEAFGITSKEALRYVPAALLCSAQPVMLVSNPVSRLDWAQHVRFQKNKCNDTVSQLCYFFTNPLSY